MTLLESSIVGSDSYDSLPQSFLAGQGVVRLGESAIVGTTINREPQPPAVPCITEEHHRLTMRYGLGDPTFTDEDKQRLFRLEVATRMKDDL